MGELDCTLSKDDLRLHQGKGFADLSHVVKWQITSSNQYMIMDAIMIRYHRKTCLQKSSESTSVERTEIPARQSITFER